MIHNNLRNLMKSMLTLEEKSIMFTLKGGCFWTKAVQDTVDIVTVISYDQTCTFLPIVTTKTFWGSNLFFIVKQK